MVLLFHYTDKTSYDSILEHGFIFPSNGKQGSGVYLTELNPKDHDPEAIANNNYGRRWEDKLEKTDHHIQVDIPKNDTNLRKVETKASNNIWVYAGRVPRSMFTSEQGANKDWAPFLAAVCVATAAAIQFSAFLASESTRAEELEEVLAERKLEKEREEAERKRKEARKAKGLMNAAPDTALGRCHIKAANSYTPSDFAASQNVEAKIQQFCWCFSKRQLRRFLWGTLSIEVVLVAIIARTQPFTLKTVGYVFPVSILTAMAVFVPQVLQAPSTESFQAPLELVIPNDDYDQFQKKKTSWIGRAWSWVTEPNPTSELKREVRVTDKQFFGCWRIASVSLPLLAGDENIERRYYWIGAFGDWYAVTLYEYNSSSDDLS